MANKTKDIQKLMPQKQAAPKPMTEQEKAQQVARFFAQKRETFFQLILANAIQAGAQPKAAVDAAIEAADYALEKLYPLPKEGEDK